MITLPQLQLPLIALLVFLTVFHGVRRQLVTACILATLLAFATYVLAIDATGQIEQTRVITDLPPEFVAASTAILGVFAFCFLASGWSVARLTKGRPVGATGNGSVLAPLIIGTGLVTLSADGWWIFAPYPQNKEIFQLVPLGGAGAAANLLILIALNRARVSGQYWALAQSAFWLTVAHYVLAGDRGSLLFLLIGAYGFHLARLRRLRWVHAVQTAVLATGLLIALDQISYLRSWGVQVQSTEGSFLAEIDLLPQSVAHLFHAIALQIAGYNPVPGGAIAFLATLWVQIIPSGFLRALGVELYNGPILLTDYVVHGGGFFVPAELYFAGGFPTLIAVSLYFGALAGWLDRLVQRREDTLMLTLVLLVAASSFYTMFYGVQAVNRMLTLPFVILFARSAYRALIFRIGSQRVW